MQLVLLRHADAQDYHPMGDRERRLTENGIKKAKALGKFLCGRYYPDLVLSSPYIRAKETAAIFCHACGIPEEKIRYTESLIFESALDEIVSEVNQYHPASCLLVGHNPHLSQLTNFLCGIHGPGIVLKKGMAACIETESTVEADKGRLLWLFPAKLFLEN